MNRKRFFTVFMVVAIAGMLIALPYESNAIAPLVAVGVGVLIGAGLTVLIGSLLHKKSIDNAQQTVQYTTDYSAYISQWNNEFEHLTNYNNRDEATAQNLVNNLNVSNLFFVRAGEYEAMQWLNKSSWDSEIEEAVTKPLDDYVYNLTITILQPYLLTFQELFTEIEKIEYTDDGNIKVELWDGSKSWTLAIGSDADVKIANFTLLYGDYSFSPLYPNTLNFINAFVDNTYNHSLWKEVYNLSGKWKVVIENTTDMSDLIDGSLYIIFKVIAYDNTNATLRNYGAILKFDTNNHDFYGNICDIKSSSFDSSRSYVRFRVYAGGSYSNAWKMSSGAWKDDLVAIYNTIRSNVITNANVVWQTYKTLGYNDVSEIPEDEQIIFPDIALENIDALGNLSYDDAFALWSSILRQLSTSDMLNKSKITWDDFAVANFSGKIATIKLVKYANPTNISDNVVLLDGERCYILPHEQDLTLVKNKTYLVASTTNFGNAFDNIVYDYLINQYIQIYSLDSGKLYNLIPDNTTVYTIYVYNLSENEQEVNSLTYDLTTAGRFLFPEQYTNGSIVLPTFQTEEDIFSWINEYKGLITIACIVLGVIFTATSRKGSGGHTLGVILLLVGIGLAFYWYILPTWHSITSFWDKLTFWD